MTRHTNLTLILMLGASTPIGFTGALAAGESHTEVTANAATPAIADLDVAEKRRQQRIADALTSESRLRVLEEEWNRYNTRLARSENAGDHHRRRQAKRAVIRLQEAWRLHESMIQVDDPTWATRRADLEASLRKAELAWEKAQKEEKARERQQFQDTTRRDHYRKVWRAGPLGR